MCTNTIETWGLRTTREVDGENKRLYLPETQYWVSSMYYLTKSLDPTRLVEDNSICCGIGHTETDLNSWHVYLPGYAWDDYLKTISDSTYPGSPHNFEDGFTQGSQPNFNSECGNVWGYEGSAGDIDWSYDYHRMINTFRKYPKIGGWLYTEHHDVINEWNGYWRFDRSEKETGLGELMSGMTLNDLHAPIYLSTGNNITYTAEAGSSLEIPLYLSVMTDREIFGPLEIMHEIQLIDRAGREHQFKGGSLKTEYTPWLQATLPPLQLEVPAEPGVAIVMFTTKDASGQVLHRNFVALEVTGENSAGIYSVSVDQFSNAQWSDKQWDARDGRKINGADSGFFEFQIPLANSISLQGVKDPYFIVELSAKELFIKDQEAFNRDQDYMKGSRVAPSSNPNSYPMTDESFHPSKVSFWIDGKRVNETTLPDDPADHRGILSWHHQLQNRKLDEAGSYGYLVKVPLSRRQLRQALKKGNLKVRIQTEGKGGIAIYGKEFGRYPVDPSIVLK